MGQGKNQNDKYSGIPIFRTSKGNGNWFEKSGVRFEKSKVASNHTCFTVELFYKIQEGRQQRYITLVNV